MGRGQVECKGNPAFSDQSILHNANYKPYYDVSFNYLNTLVVSDSTNVFLGLTAKYLFMNNTVDDHNYIFKIDDIQNLKIQQNK